MGSCSRQKREMESLKLRFGTRLFFGTIHYVSNMMALKPRQIFTYMLHACLIFFNPPHKV